MKVYPNPSNGKFTIQLSVVSCQCSVEVYNVLGERVLNKNLIGTTNEINLSKQPAGVYIYKIHSLSGEVLSTGKFVIQK